MLNIYLIRHGQSEVNAKPDQIGQSPTVPLTELGRQQSFKLNQRLRKENIIFDQVYSSPYTRALDTAKIVCGEYVSEIKLAPELVEYSAGDWLGKSRLETLTKEVKLNIAQMGDGFLFPGGESMNMVQRRASKWLEDNIIYNPEINKKTLDIGVFSHGMTIKCLLRYIMGFDQIFTWKIALDNTSLTKLSFDKDGWRIITINDYSHLR